MPVQGVHPLGIAAALSWRGCSAISEEGRPKSLSTNRQLLPYKILLPPLSRMVSQEALLNGGALSFTLLEEENPPEAIAGETKTNNFPPNQPQRDVVTYRDVTSDFSVSVQMSLCVHGWEKPDRKQAMSLMVFDYEMIYTKRNHFVKSVKTVFTFDEAAYPAEARSGEGPANPAVVAYAPFEREMRWNKTEADVKDGVHADAKFGVDYGASAELSGGREKEVSHTQKFFTRGQAGRQYNNKTGNWNRVVWFLQQNESQGDGVPSTFSVAILVKRASNANFKGSFFIRIEAGRWENWNSGWRRIFSKPEDGPINFDPEREEMGQKWETHKDKIFQDKLGLLEEDGKLTKLVEIWGLDLGSFAPQQ